MCRVEVGDPLLLGCRQFDDAVTSLELESVLGLYVGTSLRVYWVVVLEAALSVSFPDLSLVFEDGESFRTASNSLAHLESSEMAEKQLMVCLRHLNLYAGENGNGPDNDRY